MTAQQKKNNNITKKTAVIFELPNIKYPTIRHILTVNKFLLNLGPFFIV